MYHLKANAHTFVICELLLFCQVMQVYIVTIMYRFYQKKTADRDRFIKVYDVLIVIQTLM